MEILFLMQVTDVKSSISQLGFDFQQINEMISGIVSHFFYPLICELNVFFFFVIQNGLMSLSYYYFFTGRED